MHMHVSYVIECAQACLIGYMIIYVCMYTYIYIYRERERKRYCHLVVFVYQ